VHEAGHIDHFYLNYNLWKCPPVPHHDCIDRCIQRGYADQKRFMHHQNQTLKGYERIQEKKENRIMNRFWIRISGILLLAGAFVGIVISIAGLILVWIEAPRLQAGLGGLIDQGSQTLTTTQAGLSVLSTSLDQTQQALRSMQTTADDAAGAIDQTVPMAQSAAGLVGTDMTDIVKQTQTSLESARTSARFVDDTLGFISSLPIIGQRYTPTQKLSDSIDQVSKSLAGLPASLTSLQGNLNTSADNLTTLRTQVQSLSGELHQMDLSASEAKGVVQSYQTQVSAMQDSLAQARSGLPSAITTIEIGASLFFAWLAIAQIGLYFQGIDLLLGRREKPGWAVGSSARPDPLRRMRTDGRPDWSAAAPGSRPMRRPVRRQIDRD
jgi:hypothetical protein